jgi:hypothetical protein
MLQPNQIAPNLILFNTLRKPNNTLIKSQYHDLIISCLLILLPLVYSAQTTFTYSGSGDWTNQANWSPSYPGTNIGTDNTLIITNQTININLNSLTLNGEVIMNGSGSLSINSGSEVFLRGKLFINGTGGLSNNGTLEIIDNNPTFFSPEIVVSVYGFVNNFNTMDFEGTINGSVENFGNFSFTDAVTIGTSGTLTNREVATALIRNSSSEPITNNGTIDNRFRATMQGVTSLINNGVFSNSGTYRNETNSINESTGRIDNFGVFTLSSGRLTNRGTFNNASNARYEAESNLNSTLNEGVFTNNDNAIVTGPTNYQILNSNTATLVNTTLGQLNVNVTIVDAALFNNFGTFANRVTWLDTSIFNNYGTFTGTVESFTNTNHTIAGNTSHVGDFTNTGIIAPRSSPTNPIGTYTLTGALTQNGTIVLELRNATTFDRLVTNTTLNSNGSYTISLIDDYIPEIGDAFEVLSFNSSTGNFDNFNLPELPTGRIWDVQVTTNAVTLEVICGISNLTCPEPVTVNTDADSCFATNVALGDLPGELCDGFTVSNNAPSTYPVGNTEVIWTVNTPNGNFTCTQTVTVVDANTPIFACSADIETNIEANDCQALVSVPPPSITAACEVINIDCGELVSFNTFTNRNLLDNTFTTIRNVVMVEEGFTMNVIVNGPFFDSSQRLIIDGPDGNIIFNRSRIRPECTDVAFPVFISAALWNGWISTFGTDLSFRVRRNTSVPIDTPNCGNYFQLCIPRIEPVEATITNDFNNTNNATGTYPLGQTIVNWTATLPGGDALICAQSITVTDDTAPVFDIATLPESNTIRIANENTRNYSLEDFSAAARATDNCTQTTEIIQNPTAGTALSVGNHEVTLSVADQAGNPTQYVFTITVEATLSTVPANNTLQDLTVYPNPVINTLNIVNLKNNTLSSVKVYSITGALVYHTLLDTNKNLTLNLESLKAAVYFVTVESDKGRYIKQIIKK